ncbi:hypothetical protein Tco_0767051 [Tanacetum coccineum]
MGSYDERVNISTTNVRLETTVKQKEETFQVVIDVIKNSTCIKAFTISADVPEILMPTIFRNVVKDVQQYGLAIPATMLNNEIIQSKSYKRFILYSTGQIPPKKSRGKGSQGKKSAYLTEESVDVSDESEPEPLIRRKISSRRVVKKKATISVDDTIVPKPDIALELGKSISLTEAEEEAAARQVYATHARIVSESIPEPTRRRRSNIAISETTQKLKGIQSLTPTE